MLHDATFEEVLHFIEAKARSMYESIFVLVQVAGHTENEVQVLAVYPSAPLSKCSCWHLHSKYFWNKKLGKAKFSNTQFIYPLPQTSSWFREGGRYLPTPTTQYFRKNKPIKLKLFKHEVKLSTPSNTLLAPRGRPNTYPPPHTHNISKMTNSKNQTYQTHSLTIPSLTHPFETESVAEN